MKKENHIMIQIIYVVFEFQYLQEKIYFIFDRQIFHLDSYAILFIFCIYF